MLNQSAVMEITKNVDDENEENFNILRRRLSQATRQYHRTARQNMNLQKELLEIKKDMKKILKLASGDIDYSESIKEICKNILGEK